jgi:hypothetical protein
MAFKRNVGQTSGLCRIIEKDFLHRIQVLKTKIYRTFLFRQGSFQYPPSSPLLAYLKVLVFAYGDVPRFWLHYGENPTSIAVGVLELFSLQSLAFYFEMDSNHFGLFISPIIIRLTTILVIEKNIYLLQY